MTALASFADFLLAKWLWSMTFDWYHLLINLFLMTFLFRNVRQATLPRAILFSFTLQVVAFGLFTLIVVGLMFYGLGWEYVQPDLPQLPLPNYVMRACLWLGIIYSVAQTLFIFAWHAARPFARTPYLVVIWMGNFLAAVMSYCCILVMSSLSL